MKKLVSLVVVLCFVLGLVATSADAAVKKVAKKPVKKVVKKVVPAPKPIVPPPPAPVPPPPAPKAKAAAPAGMFGWGLQTGLDLGLVAGNLFGVTYSMFLPDPLGLGAVLGLPSNAVNYKLGLGYASGNDKNSNNFKAVPIYFDGVISLPMGGMDTYIGGGLNYTVKVGAAGTGQLGGEAYVGIQGDLGLAGGSKTYAQVGVGALRSSNRSTGLSLQLLVGQKIML